MGSGNNILAVFAASPPPEAPPKADVKPGRDDGFRDHLDVAMRTEAAAQDSQKSQAENSNQESVDQKNSQRVSAKKNQSAREAQSSGQEESFNSHLEDAAQASESPATQAAGNDNQDRKTLEKLAALDLDQEKVNAILELLQGDQSYDAASILQALTQIAETDDLSTLAPFQNGASQQEVTGIGRNNKIADLLAKAGIDQQDARDFLEKLQLSNLLQNSTDKTLKAGDGDTTTIKLATDSEASAELTNQASRQSKSNPDGETKSKADFLAQLNLKSHGQTDSSEGKASIEKVLAQESNKTQTIASKEDQSKIQSLGQAQHERLADGEAQAPILNTQKIIDPLSAKAVDAAKPGNDFQIQSVSGAGDISSKSVESGKPVFSETLAARTASETKVIQQILEKFTPRSSGDQSQIKIRLDPPSLGTVRMNISTAGESVRTVIIAENHMVKQVIENNFAQLRDSLAGQGMKLDGFSVLVGGDSGQGGFNQPQGEGAGYGQTPTGGKPQPMALEDFSSPSVRTGVFTHDNQSLSVFV